MLCTRTRDGLAPDAPSRYCLRKQYIIVLYGLGSSSHILVYAYKPFIFSDVVFCFRFYPNLNNRVFTKWFYRPRHSPMKLKTTDSIAFKLFAAISTLSADLRISFNTFVKAIHYYTFCRTTINGLNDSRTVRNGGSDFKSSYTHTQHGSIFFCRWINFR